MTINAYAVNAQAINAFDSSRLISLSTTLSSSSSCPISTNVVCVRGLISLLVCGSSTPASKSPVIRNVLSDLGSVSISAEDVDQVINRYLSTTIGSSSLSADSVSLVPIKTLIGVLGSLSESAPSRISVNRLFTTDLGFLSSTPDTISIFPNGFLKLISVLGGLSETSESGSIEVRRSLETVVDSDSAGALEPDILIVHKSISTIQSLSDVSFRTRLLREVVAAIRSKMDVNVSLKKPSVGAEADRPSIEGGANKIPSLIGTSF